MSTPLNISRRRTAADIAVQLSGWPLNIVLGIVVMFVLVRMLGAQRFGEWSTIAVTVEIATTFATLGVEGVAIKHIAGDSEQADEWLSSLVMIRTVLSVPVALVALGVLVLMLHSGQGQLAALLVCSTLLLSGPQALRAVFRLRVRNDVTMGLMTLNSLLWTSAVLLISALSGGLVALAAALLAVSALTAALQAALALRHIRLRLREGRRHWRALTHLGALTGISSMLTMAYGRIDQVIVFNISGAHAAGLYAAPYRLLDRAQFVPVSLTMTLFPIIAAAYGSDTARVRRLLQRAIEYLAVASLPLLAFTVVAAHPIVRLLFGPQFDGSAPALPVLMGALVAISFGYLIGYMAVVVPKVQRYWLRNAVIGLVVNVGLNLLLVPRYGFMAAAWVTVLTEVVVNALTARALLRELQWRPQVGRLLRIVLASAAMGLVCAAMRSAQAPLAVLVSAGGLGYAGALGLLRALELGPLLALVRREAV